jgi:hypothetical protein
MIAQEKPGDVRRRRAWGSYPPIRKLFVFLERFFSDPNFIYYRDTISSHEKKRHYVECLEQYITYLHEQFEVLGAVSAMLTRVSMI